MTAAEGADVSEQVEPVPGDEGTDAPDDEIVEAPRRRRTALVISLVVGLVVAGFVFVLATGEAARNRRTDSPLLGREAPAVAGETLVGGSFDIGDHGGSWVVVNFFATWCPPCRQEHPELVGFDRTHRRLDDAVLVSVLFDDDPDTARAFFEDQGGEWPVVIDGRGGIATDFGVTGVPETFLIAPDGRVVARLLGGVTQAGLEQVMADWDAARRADDGGTDGGDTDDGGSQDAGEEGS